MSERFSFDILRISIAQICQTIGYSTTHTAPLELLQDVLHKYLEEITKTLHRNVEHYNRTEPNLNDLALTLHFLNTNIKDAIDYVQNVEPVPFIHNVPRYPVRKGNNLNFLKPGSSEVLSRPVHIYEYLPPILPPDPETTTNVPAKISRNESSKDNSQEALDEKSEINDSAKENENCRELTTKSASSLSQDNAATKSPSNVNNVKPSISPTAPITKAISSVLMTTGGFISPAVEGRLPHAIVPDFVEKLRGVHAPPKEPSPSPIPVELNRESIDNEANSVTTEDVNEMQQFEGTATLKFEGSVPATLKIEPKENVKKLKKVHSADATPTNLATKLLKKARKKNTLNISSGMLPQASASAFSPVIKGVGSRHSKNKLKTAETLAAAAEKKLQRKHMKLLQKYQNKPSVGIMNEPDNNMMIQVCKTIYDGNILLTPEMVTGLPIPERQRMEKMLKKQEKQKQKLLKQTGSKKKKQQSRTELMPPMMQGLPDSMKFNLQTASAPSGVVGGGGVEFNPQQLCNDGQQNKKESKGIGTLLPPPTTPFHYGASEQMGIGGTEQLQQPSHTNAKAEIKLSNEPDRNKLNIFKKISKQKGGALKQPPLSPNVGNIQQQHIGAGAGAAAIFAGSIGSESQMINLPSGTTITPALPIDCAVYGKDDIGLSGKDNKGSADDMTAIAMGIKPIAGFPNVQPNFNFIGSMNQQAAAGNVNVTMPNVGLNLPKKRGRKPKQATGGIPAIVKQADSAPKRAKKMKVLLKSELGAGGFQVPPTVESLAEPLNLTTPCTFQGSKEALTVPPYTNLNAFFPQSNTKPRKERKNKQIKNKQKLPGDLFPRSSVPSKEEVSSINKKLLRMDTVLKPAPPLPALSVSTDFLKPESTATVAPAMEHLHSPLLKQGGAYKSPGNSSKKLKVATTNIMASPGSTTMLPKLNPSFAGTTTNNAGSARFPQMPPNIMPILPIYPFPPRPGLIPSPAIFPNPGLSSFSRGNHQGHPADPSNILLPSPFIPIPNLKTFSAMNADMEKREKSEEYAESLRQVGDRGFCNVAPLVPESMKLLSPPEPKFDCLPFAAQSQSAANRDRATKQTKTHESLIPKTEYNPDPSKKLRRHEKMLEAFAMGGSQSQKSTLPESSSIFSAMVEDMEKREKSEEYAESLRQVGDRGFCNVAPLVPESMKLLSPPEPKFDCLPFAAQSQSAANRDRATKQTKTHESLIPKTEYNPDPSKKLRRHEKMLEAFAMGGSQSQKSTLPESSGIFSGMVEGLNNNQNNKKGQIALNAQKLQKPLISFQELGKQITDKHNNPLNVLKPSPMPINLNDPIEVSDDSNEAVPTMQINKTKTTSNQNLSKTTSSSHSLASAMLNICAAKPTPETDSHQEVKKLKKQQRVNKKSFYLNTAMPLNMSGLEVFVDEKVNSGGAGGTGGTGGISKLAGGADLIPLTGTGTGLAYSAKTIPMSSLTGAIGLMAPKKEKQHQPTPPTPSSSAASIFENLTIIPTTPQAPPGNLMNIAETLKKRKEHKKLKKLKDGKIKKKKDKKDKSKNKERLDKQFIRGAEKLSKEKHVEKHKDKELLKKLKKERKKEKEKQRMSLDAPTNLSVPMPQLQLQSTSNLPTTVQSLAVESKSSNTNKNNNSTIECANIVPRTNVIITGSNSGTSDNGKSAMSAASLVPKLTLKLSGTGTSSPSPTQSETENISLRIMSPTTITTTKEREKDKREPSPPELARISPLITRPPKQKQIAGESNNHSQHATSGAVIIPPASGNTGNASSGDSHIAFDNLKTSPISSGNAISTSAHSVVLPPSPWLTGVTLTASSVLLPQQLLLSSSNVSSIEPTSISTQAITTATSSTPISTATNNTSVLHPPTDDNSTSRATSFSKHSSPPVHQLHSESNRPSSYIDEEGNRVWICPACGKVDDGSAMIGCDSCDAWYHWVCVGIYVAPKDNEDWFCRVCITRKKGQPNADKKRKRNKKKLT